MALTIAYIIHPVSVKAQGVISEFLQQSANASMKAGIPRSKHKCLCHFIDSILQLLPRKADKAHIVPAERNEHKRRGLQLNYVLEIVKLMIQSSLFEVAEGV